MRRIVLILCALLTLVWTGVGIWAARHTPPVDVMGLHFFGTFFILPAWFLAAINWGLRTALVLVCVTAFVYLSVLIAGQISN